jgi:preprotein translocase subunit SecD
MTAASQQLFSDFTSKKCRPEAEILVDGRALTAPVIREPILGGSGQIKAGFKLEEAKEAGRPPIVRRQDGSRGR